MENQNMDEDFEDPNAEEEIVQLAVDNVISTHINIALNDSDEPWEDVHDIEVKPEPMAFLRHNPQISKQFAEHFDKQIALSWLNSTPADVAQKLIVQDWFRKLVPLIYAPQKDMNCLQLEFDEELGPEMLLTPLERYIFNNEDPNECLEKLGNMCYPASLCGRVFKAGEPTYSCRDCGLDPTCVLCVDCFKNSAHQTHRYKISTSSGGGYCDCGDNEAWKSDFYCSVHDPDVLQQRGTSLEDIQPGLRDRMDLILSIAISYCVNRFWDNFNTEFIASTFALTGTEKTELGVKDDDTYCTVLYNDESHTFEVVIQTLQRAISCSKKEAIDFATMIDREGRSVVKIADFTECVRVKQVSEKQTSRTGQKPLRIQVLHSFAVAHQIFALRLMAWLKKMVTYSTEIREIFYDIMTRTSDLTRPESSFKDGKPQACWLETVLLSDTELCKCQRSAYHNLLVAAFLKDYETKKKFAVKFTTYYPDLFKDFIEDDHDHAISITSLSVQIYTVPTISLFLLEHHDVIFAIMRTFVSEFEQKLNNDGKLQLQRASNSTFKRAQYAMLDVKYLLTNIPKEWSDPLRKPFIHGVNCVIKLLAWMQEMDAFVRQTGAHMEFEPEWETAFNFHVKLTPVTSLIQQWCTTDEAICIRTYRYVLNHMKQVYKRKPLTTCCRELVNHSATCYEYDVLSKEISIHSPLTRFAAGLHLAFDRFGLNFNSAQFSMDDKPTPLILMEPSLRVLVLVAQVHCGLWKRNGFALLNQLYFYHNVMYRNEMFDKDILCLQVGASLVESNEYLLHLLNRFGLMFWAENDFDDKPFNSDDDSARAIATIAEQFFTLINTLVSARYVIGVGQVTEKDCVQYEIIQYLCKQAMTHSQINKVLVENVNGETGLEKYVEEVATFKQSSNAKSKFQYELKPEFYDKFDIFHYHFTNEEMSTAEERQRYRKKSAGEPEIFPPPKLPLFTEQFSLVPNILKSDVLLNLMALVIQRSTKKSSRSFSDSQLRMVLHLIGQGLNEEATRNETECSRDHYFQFSTAAKQWKIFNLLEGLLKETNLSHHHEMILWIFRTYQFLKPLNDLSTIENLVQKSQTEEENLKKKKKAAETRARRLAEMNAAQKNFYCVNADLFDKEDDKSCPEVEAAAIPENPIVLGPNQSQRCYKLEKRMCILCHNEELLSEATSVFVLCAFVQRSTVMAQNKSYHLDAEKQKNRRDHLIVRNPLFLPSDLATAPHVASCGHAMHSTCWKKHIDGIMTKERRRPYRQQSSFDVEKGEYLCPMCGSLSNTILLVTQPCFLSKETEIAAALKNKTLDNFDSFLYAWRNTINAKSISEQHITTRNLIGPPNLNILKSVELGKPAYEYCESDTTIDERLPLFYFAGGSSKPARVHPPLTNDDISKSFLITVFTHGLDAAATDADYRLPIMLWQAISYAIISLEATHRELQTPFFGESVPTRESETICGLTRSGTTMTAVANLQRVDGQESIRSLAIKLMLSALYGPTKYGLQVVISELLETDAFNLLVSITYATPHLLTDKGKFIGDMGGSDVVCLKDLYLLRLVTYIHFIQIIASNDFSGMTVLGDETSESMNPTEDDASSQFEDHCRTIWAATNKFFPEKFDWKLVWKSVCEASVPFLRCAAKFYESLTGISPGKNLGNIDNCFEDLTHFLGLPTNWIDFCPKIDDGFMQYMHLVKDNDSQSTFLHRMKDLDSDEPGPSTAASTPGTFVVTYPRKIAKFAVLPHDYAELINSVGLFTCENCDDNDSRLPTMCLICGKILCSQSFCCQYQLENSQVGACSYHTYFCGGGVGIFLRIRECKVFYLYGAKGAFIFPPYLDAYGETDQGLRRGNPMTLSLEKYENYRRTWMVHNIPEDIARITELSSAITAADWQYL